MWRIWKQIWQKTWGPDKSLSLACFKTGQDIDTYWYNHYSAETSAFPPTFLSHLVARVSRPAPGTVKVNLSGAWCFVVPMGLSLAPKLGQPLLGPGLRVVWAFWGWLSAIVRHVRLLAPEEADARQRYGTERAETCCLCQWLMEAMRASSQNFKGVPSPPPAPPPGENTFLQNKNGHFIF